MVSQSPLDILKAASTLAAASTAQESARRQQANAAALSSEAARTDKLNQFDQKKVDDAFTNYLTNKPVDAVDSMTPDEQLAYSNKVVNNYDAKRDSRTTAQTVGDIANDVGGRVGSVLGGLAQGAGDYLAANALYSQNPTVQKVGLNISKGIEAARDYAGEHWHDLHSTAFKKAEAAQNEEDIAQESAWQAHKAAMQQSNNVVTDAFENIGHAAVQTLTGFTRPITGASKVATTALDVATLGNKYLAPVVGLSDGISGAREAFKNVSNDDLAKNSPIYQHSIAIGDSPEIARAKALYAKEAIQGGTQAAINTGLAQFGLAKAIAPKVTGAITGTLKDLVTGGGDMAAASAAGKLGENLADRVSVDRNRNPLEGVGEAAEEGLGSGVALTGITHAIGAPPAIASSVARTALKAGKAITPDITQKTAKAFGKAAETFTEKQRDTGHKQIAGLSEAIKDKSLDTKEPIPASVSKIVENSSSALDAIDQLGRQKFSTDEERQAAQNVQDIYKSRISDAIPDAPVDNKAFSAGIAAIKKTIGDVASSNSDLAPKTENATDAVSSAFKDGQNDPKKTVDNLSAIIHKGEDSKAAFEASHEILNNKDIRDSATEEQVDLARTVQESLNTPSEKDVLRIKALGDNVIDTDLSPKERLEAAKEYTDFVTNNPGVIDSEHSAKVTEALQGMVPADKTRHQDEATPEQKAVYKYLNDLKETKDIRDSIIGDDGGLRDTHKEVVYGKDANGKGHLSFRGHIAKIASLIQAKRTASNASDKTKYGALLNIAVDNLHQFVEHMGRKAEAAKNGEETYDAYLGRDRDGEHVIEERPFKEEEHTNNFKEALQSEYEAGQKALSNVHDLLKQEKTKKPVEQVEITSKPFEDKAPPKPVEDNIPSKSTKKSKADDPNQPSFDFGESEKILREAASKPDTESDRDKAHKDLLDAHANGKSKEDYLKSIKDYNLSEEEREEIAEDAKNALDSNDTKKLSSDMVKAAKGRKYDERNLLEDRINNSELSKKRRAQAHKFLDEYLTDPNKPKSAKAKAEEALEKAHKEGKSREEFFETLKDHDLSAEEKKDIYTQAIKKLKSRNTKSREDTSKSDTNSDKLKAERVLERAKEKGISRERYIKTISKYKLSEKEREELHDRAYGELDSESAIAIKEDLKDSKNAALKKKINQAIQDKAKTQKDELEKEIATSKSSKYFKAAALKKLRELTEPSKGSTEEDENPDRVVLSGRPTKILEKDQAKADKANRFIGFGAVRSSTARYSNDFERAGKANTGEKTPYTKDDKVFVSVNGDREDRIKISDADFKEELDRALDVGATIIADIKADRRRKYNVGERELAEYLEARGYEETEDGNGIWKKVEGEEESPENAEDIISPEKDFGRIPSEEVFDPKSFFSKKNDATGEDIKKENTFLNTFEPTKSGSKVSGWTKPFTNLQVLLEHLRGLASDTANDLLNQFAGREGLHLEYSSNDFKELASFLRVFTKSKLLDVVNAAIKKDYKKIKDEALASNQLMMSLCGNGTTELHSTIAEAALLSLAYTHIKNALQGTSPLSDEEIRSQVGAKTLSSEQIQLNKTGVSRTFYLRDFKRNLEKLLGIKQGDLASYYDAGMLTTLGNYFLEAAAEKGILKKTVIDYVDMQEKPKKLTYFHSTDKANPRNFQECSDKLLDTLLLKEPKQAMYVEGEETPVAKRVLHSDIELTEHQQDAVKVSNNTKYTLHYPAFEYIHYLYKNKILHDILGAIEHKDMNVNYKASVKGKAVTIETAIFALRRYKAAIEKSLAFRELPEDDWENSPIRFATDITSVNRTQLSGESPVNSKLLRIVFAPHTMEMNKGLDNDVERFKKIQFDVAIAQQLGMKIQKINSLQEFTEGFNDLLNKHRDAIDYFKGKKQASIDALKKSVNGDLVVLHALIERARYEDHEGAEPFKTNIYIEQDGATNGSAFAYRLFKSTDYTIKDKKRGNALGFSPIGESINETAKDTPDLYEQDVSAATDKITEDLKVLPLHEPHRGLYDALHKSLVQFISEYHPDMREDGGQLDFTRSGIKPWGQIVVYGGGSYGLSVKMLHEAMMGYYKEISDKNYEVPEHIREALEVLATSKLKLDRKLGYVVEKDFSSNLEDITSKEFTFPQKFEENTASAIKTLYGDSTAEAVKTVIGEDIASNLEAVRTVAQAQSAFLKMIYKDALLWSVKLRHPDIEDDSKLIKYIAPLDVENALSKLKRYGSQVNVKDKYTLGFVQDSPAPLSVGHKDARVPAKVGTKPEDGVPLDLPNITDNGNGDIAKLVLSAGDGAAMNEYFVKSKSEGSLETLSIFDGINAPPDRASKVVKRINTAMAEVVKYNPVAEIAKNFSEKKEKMIRLLDELQERNENTGFILAKELHISLDNGETSEEALEYVKEYYSNSLDNLTQIGEDIAAHLDKLKKFNITNSDYVSLIFNLLGGVDIPYPESGGEEKFNWPDFIAAFSGKEGNSADTASNEDKPSNVLDKNQLLNSLNKTYRVSAEQHQMLRELLNSNAVKNNDLTFTFKEGAAGSASITNNKDIVVNKGIEGEEGNAQKVLESLTHEVIHAATEHALEFKDGEFTNETTRKVQSLMHLVLKHAESDQDNAELDRLSKIIEAQDSEEGKVAEFMAWGLSDEAIATELHSLRLIEDKTGKNYIERFKTKVKQLVKSLFNIGAEHKHSVYNALKEHVATLSSMDAEQPNTVSNITRQQARYGENDLTAKSSALGAALSTLDAAKEEQDVVNNDIKLNILKLQSSGVKLDAQQQKLFQDMAYSTQAMTKLDGVFSTKIHKIYDIIVSNLDKTSSLPETTKDLLLNPKTNINDKMAMTTALAVVHPEFKDFISTLDYKEKNLNKDFNSKVGDLGDTIISKLTDVLTKTDAKNTLPSQLRDLLGNIQEATDKENKFFQRTAKGNYLDTATKAVNDALEKASENLKESPNTKIKFLGEILSKEGSEEIADRVLGWFNKRPTYFARELANDIMGSTKGNTDVYAHLKKIRGDAQNLRQDVIENTPTVLSNSFKKPLADKDWETLNNTHAKYDLASFRDYTELSKTLEDTTKAKKDLVAQIKAEAGSNADTMLSKAEQLAEYLHSGKTGKNLLSNSYAIASLLGERGHNVENQSNKNLVSAIDKYVSILGLEKAKPEDIDFLKTKMKEEPEGMQFMHNLMANISKGNEEKAQSAALYSHIKGYIPDKRVNEEHIITIRDSDAAKYLKMGYTRLGDYKGSSIEPTKEKRGYYYLPIDGDTLYMQGGLQNIQETCNGVSTATGLSHNHPNAGLITDRRTVGRIFRLRNREQAEYEGLRPIYSSTGLIKAYERTLSPEVMGRLPYDTNLSRKIGRAMGRHIEESVADNLNKGLVKTLYDSYDPKRKDEYTNILDPELKDIPTKKIVGMLSPSVLEEAQKLFGEGKFFIRNEQLNDVIGMHRASIGDMWTGNSRWSPETQRNVEGILTRVFGKEAFIKVKRTEKAIQGISSATKNNIVVKSVIVPWNNLKGNIVQLMLSGVPITQMVKTAPKKLAEIEAYTKNTQLKTKLLIRQSGSSSERERAVLQSRIDAIDALTDKLSIAPLIRANELSSVASDRYQTPTSLLKEGKLHKYMETLVDQLPESVRELGNYAVVSKNTALYTGLEKAVEYGDFIAKAMLYDHLTRNKQLSEREALNNIRDAFVDYDRMSGRNRDYIESMGLGWFINFKLRSVKSAVYIMRHEPLRTLLEAITSHSTVFGNIGTPLNDNIFSQAIDGNISHSFGIGEMFRGVTMNPYYNLLF